MQRVKLVFSTKFSPWKKKNMVPQFDWRISYFYPFLLKIIPKSNCLITLRRMTTFKAYLPIGGIQPPLIVFYHCKAFDDIKGLPADGRDAAALDGALEIPGQRSVAASTVVLISEEDPHY